MNKLDEIEEHIDKEGIILPTFTAKLIIRAVRQLGEVYKAAYQEDKSVAFFVDHDVLALLEDADA